MSGFVGCLAHSTEECVKRIFYMTDYHSHLGAENAGVAFLMGKVFLSEIHSISDGKHFRDLFEQDIAEMIRRSEAVETPIKFGLGIISDRDPQPLMYRSRFGDVAIVTVGRVPNLNQLAKELGTQGSFSLRENGKINIAEVVIRLMEEKADLVEGIRHMWSRITGSLSLIMIFSDGRMIGARDRYGVSPLVLGRGDGGVVALASEVSSFFNLGIKTHHFLKPGEIVQVSQSRITTLTKGCQGNCRTCAFNWVYAGFPASAYEGIGVEPARNRCGAALASHDNVEVDIVAGIPDSGTGHAIGYANKSGMLFGRPLMKYTPTWPRSYLPATQALRDMIAEMKLLPVMELIEGKRLLFCEDSIVRGTQLHKRIRNLYELGAQEVHIRVACPPLMWPCPNLRATREFDELAARRSILELEGSPIDDVSAYLDPDSDHYARMVAKIGTWIKATSLKYLTLDDMVAAIGLPKDQLCTYCWTGIPIDRNGLIED
ncbi:MAG: amidophosphoribosyltransferase [Patescibacteria group bacterium]|jgi:amidophosphoribosyltransferase